MPLRALTWTLFSLAVLASGSRLHAGNGLPEEILGLWCYYSEGESADALNYLRNDASAPKPDTPCSKESDTGWIVIDSDGSYRAKGLECRATNLAVIDPGEVIRGTPGANAVYGVEARCAGNGNTWSERARLEVERWGSALTVKRAK